MASPIDFYHVSLKLLLKNAQGQLLALRIPSTWHGAGKLDFPGGRINEDEFTTPFEEVLRREAAEELGDDVHFDVHPHPVAMGRHLLPNGYIPEDWKTRPEKDLHIMYIFFEADHRGGEPKLSEEHDGWRWVDLNTEPIQQTFIPGIADALERYLSRRT